MPYEIKERDGKFFVVDTESKRIRGTYDSEDRAEDRKDELDFRQEVRERMSRMPVTEMTAEEKAAAYDKLIAAQNQPKSDPDPNLPPKKDDVDKDKKPKRSAYWGDQLEEN